MTEQTYTQAKIVLTRPLAGTLLCLFGFIGPLASLFLPAGSYQFYFQATGLPRSAAGAAAYCGLVVLLTSLIDRFDEPQSSSTYGDFGRFFLGAGSLLAAFAVALAATQALYLPDLLIGSKVVPAIAVTAALSAVFWYLTHRASSPNESLEQISVADSHAQAGQGRLMRGILAVALMAVAAFLLNQRYAEYRMRDAEEDQLNAQERARAPQWNYGIDSFAAGTSPDEIKNQLNRAGYKTYCPRTLASESKMDATDKANCWTVINGAMGMPAKLASFWFGERGLRSYMLRFEAHAWDDVQRYLDQNGQRLEMDFGRGPATGGPIKGWRFDAGLVMAAAPTGNDDITVLWTAKEAFARKECVRRIEAKKSGRRSAILPLESWWPGLDCGDLLARR